MNLTYNTDPNENTGAEKEEKDARDYVETVVPDSEKPEFEPAEQGQKDS
jgi:hypothetical protein